MMDRDKVLQEELEKNAAAVADWQLYAHKQQTLIWNINEFSKKLSVNVLVPIGSKAHMPGTLVHTGEVLVAHSEELVSKCSAYKAIEICNLRLHRATEMLSKLERERQLFMDKLTKPMELGAFPGDQLVEIIEEYTEERAQDLVSGRQSDKPRQGGKPRKKTKPKPKVFVPPSWKPEGLGIFKELYKKIDIKEFMEQIKAQDKEQQAAKNAETSLEDSVGTDISLAKPLEIAALAGDGQQEINEESNEDSAKDLVSGRQAVQPRQESPTQELLEEFRREVLEGDVKDFVGTDISLETLQAILKEEQIAKNEETSLEDFLAVDAQKEQTYEEIFDSLEKLSLKEAEENEMAALDNEPPDPQTNEILRKLMAGEIKPRISKQRVAFNSRANSDETTEASEAKPKAVEDAIIESAGQENNLEENSEKECFKKRCHTNAEPNKMPLQELNLQDNAMEERNKSQKEVDSTSQNEPKRRVSFSSAQETLEFVRSERVTEMRWRTPTTEEAKAKQKVPEIGETLDNDCIYIPVRHSAHVGIKTTVQEAEEGAIEAHGDTPGTPADFYDMYLKLRKSKTVVETEKEWATSEHEKADVPFNKEESPRKELLAHPTKAERKKLAQPKPPVEPKSILRNKNVPDQYRNSAYFSTVGDIVEHQYTALPTAPDPLPKGKFTNVHAPKQRISRFKQMRTKSAKS